MNDRALDRLFDRFRRQGDVQALAEVFDATAPELLRIAASLVRDPNEADDLLQQTFLTAIERSQRYDISRRLVPWLLGILVRCAREERRRRARPLGDARALDVLAAPDAHADAHELERELDLALAALPAEDRALLDAYLRADKTPAELARERGLAPGATRMRIHRGLERLRKALPASLALGGAAGALHGQGLASVRATVLAAARDHAPALAGASGGAGLIGGIIMGNKLAFGVVAVVLALGAWFMSERRDDRALDVAHAAMEERAAASRAEPARADFVAPSASTTADAAAEPASTPARAAQTRDADADRAGLRGRVVDHAGTPVPGLAVALLEIDEKELFTPFAESLGSATLPRIVAVSTVTDPAGEFVLRGATSDAFHALGIDLGGERSSLRWLDAVLAPGATADLGDVVLAATGELSGRVVDEGGRPVAGARVRAGVIPELVLAFGMQHLGAGGAVTERRRSGELEALFEVPDWLAPLEAKLPLATTTTDADGRFRFAHAAAGTITVLVDAPGFARLTEPPLQLAPDSDEDASELVLVAGRSVRGRVLDAAGAPVAGAEVRAGVAGQLVVFGAIHASDGEGRFAIEHLPGGGDVVVCGRRDALAPWRSAREEDGAWVLRLERETELLVEAVDAGGRPVPAPEFFASAGRKADAVGPFRPPPRALQARAVETSPGRWSLGPRADGWVRLTARADGFAPATDEVEITSGTMPPVRLVLAPARRVEVEVIAAATREPIADAHVRVFAAKSDPLASARTDASGRASLALPADAAGLGLVVEHPRFAPAQRTLASGDPVAVELTDGARLVARIVDPDLARRACVLELRQDDEYVLRLPRFCAVPGDGTLELARLAPGKWSWSLYEAFSSVEALSLLDPMRAPQVLEKGEVELVAGQTRELALGAPAPAPPPPVDGASLAGTVRIEGRVPGMLMVNLCPIDGGRESETLSTEAAGGRFRFDDVPPGNYILIVDGPTSTGFDDMQTLVQEEIQLARGDERTLEYDVQNIPALVRVLDQDGNAVDGAELDLFLFQPGASSVSTQVTSRGGGLARTTLAHAGHFRIRAFHPEQGFGEGEFDVAVDADNETTVSLSRGVECAGTLHVDARGRSDGRTMLHVLTAEGSWLGAAYPVEIEGGSAEFRLVGLAPGKYRAALLEEESRLQAEFELPEWGNGALELRFEPRERSPH